MRSTMMDFPLTLTSILERAGKYFGRVENVSRMPDGRLHRTTYADFHRRSRGLAAALVGAGLKRGDRVATLMWNHAWHLEAYFGVPAAAGVVHTLNLRLHSEELAHVINDAQDRFLIVDDILLPLVQSLAGKAQFERVIVVPLTGKPVPAGYDNYEEFLGADPGSYRYPVIEENEAAAMCYTSGTTGRPKGVAYSHRSLVLHSFAIALSDSFGFGQRDAVLPVVPMFHVNAWGLPFACTMVGARQVFPGPHLDAASLLELCEKEKVTLSAGVPTIWISLLDQLDKNPGRWKLEPQLRLVVGGAAPPEALLRGFDKHGIELGHAWGMTETSPAGTISQLKSYMQDDPEEQRYAVRARQGLALPFVEIRAMHDGIEAPWDGETQSELQIRGPWIAGGYHNLPEERDKWTEDGWFCTGDVVNIDAEGYMKIVDRAKDLIKSGGEWISSVDLENALMGHPAVREAAVIAVPHPKWQERPLAAVVLREGMEATAGELHAFLKQQFSRWQLPDAIIFVTEIPRTATGKFLKAKLRKQFAEWQWEKTD